MDSVGRRPKIRKFCSVTSSGLRSTSTAPSAGPQNIRHWRLRITMTLAARQARKPCRSSGTNYTSITFASRNCCSASIEERRSRGEDIETAFRDALSDVVPDGFDEESDQRGFPRPEK